MIKFCSLFSGSSGNCIFIGTDRAKILIDAGVSASRIEAGLRALDEDPDAIDAILITHEHSDHTRGAGIFARRHRCAVFANAGTWEAMRADIGDLDASLRVVTAKAGGADFSIGDLQICSFPISHDAADPVAYTFYTRDRQISVVTDLGVVSDAVRACVMGSDAVLLESNHDLTMLQNGPYTWPLKKRILSDRGHLCNDAAADLAAELAQDGTKCILLGHLSRENNLPELAFRTTRDALYERGFRLNVPERTVSPDIFRLREPTVHLSVAPRDGSGAVILA